MENFKGNVTSILKTVLMAISGFLIASAAAKGYNFPVSETELTEILFTIATLVLAYFDAKHPNSFAFLDNQTTCDCDTECLCNCEEGEL